jgi:hypothetical protein
MFDFELGGDLINEVVAAAVVVDDDDDDEVDEDVDEVDDVATIDDVIDVVDNNDAADANDWWASALGGERPSLRIISSDFSGFFINGGGCFLTFTTPLSLLLFTVLPQLAAKSLLTLWFRIISFTGDGGKTEGAKGDFMVPAPTSTMASRVVVASPAKASLEESNLKHCTCILVGSVFTLILVAFFVADFALLLLLLSEPIDSDDECMDEVGLDDEAGDDDSAVDVVEEDFNLSLLLLLILLTVALAVAVTVSFVPLVAAVAAAAAASDLELAVAVGDRPDNESEDDRRRPAAEPSSMDKRRRLDDDDVASLALLFTITVVE